MRIAFETNWQLGFQRSLLPREQAPRKDQRSTSKGGKQKQRKRALPPNRSQLRDAENRKPKTNDGDRVPKAVQAAWRRNKQKQPTAPRAAKAAKHQRPQTTNRKQKAKASAHPERRHPRSAKGRCEDKNRAAQAFRNSSDHATKNHHMSIRRQRGCN